MDHPSKLACTCGHGKTIHHQGRSYFKRGKANPCNFPGCRCKRYKRAKKRA